MHANSILFIDTVNELLAAIGKAENIVKEIMHAPNLDKVVSEVSDTTNRITVLEPAILNIRMKQLTNVCGNIVLIGIIQERDPKYELRTETGESWYELAKGPNIVRAIKAVRECFGPVRIDIKDGKAIYELVQAGVL